MAEKLQELDKELSNTVVGIVKIVHTCFTVSLDAVIDSYFSGRIHKEDLDCSWLLHTCKAA